MNSPQVITWVMSIGAEANKFEDKRKRCGARNTDVMLLILRCRGLESLVIVLTWIFMHNISRMLTYWPSNTGSLECPVSLSSTFQATKHIIISCLSEAKTHSNTACVGTSVCHQAISVTTNFPSVLHPDKLNLQLWHFSSSVCLPLPRWKAVEWRQRARGRERVTYKERES